MKTSFIFLILSFTFSELWAQSTWPPVDIMKMSDVKVKVNGVMVGPHADGINDDTKHLKAAMDLADKTCINGQGKSYRVEGTIQSTKDVCLQNMTIIQSMAPIDTTKYIKSGDRPAQTIGRPEDDPYADLANIYVSYPEDPTLPADSAELKNLKKWLSLRTLYFYGADDKKIKVHLKNVVVNKGSVESAGDRAKSAGIYVTNADPVEMNEVEVTGGGFGPGIKISDSSNVLLSKLNIHDLTWGLIQEKEFLLRSISERKIDGPLVRPTDSWKATRKQELF
jgi:hypothetical protein